MKLTLTYQKENAVIALSGDFIQYSADREIEKLTTDIRRSNPPKIIFQDAGIGRWDSSLLVILYDIAKSFPQSDIVSTNLPDGLKRLLNLARTVHRAPEQTRETKSSFLEQLGSLALNLLSSTQRGISFLIQIAHSLWRWSCGQAVMRPVDFGLAFQNCGPRAVGIVSLISFMVGLILAFVGAIQLKSFGAQIYVASLVAIGMTRIMGAIMIGIIMAGRTGASYAAAIGTMQVNEELDALKTMGIPQADFLVLPRLLATVLAMPFLVMLADGLGMLGGAAVGVLMLGLSPVEYWQYSLEACTMTNFLVGLFHGIVFGVVIALCGCYFGITCGRQSDSVGLATTRAVVYAIVWMIMMTGLITLICEVLGI